MSYGNQDAQADGCFGGNDGGIAFSPAGFLGQAGGNLEADENGAQHTSHDHSWQITNRFLFLYYSGRIFCPMDIRVKELQ